MSDIFISYAAVDRSRVQPLADALAGHSWSVWWDREIPTGSTFRQVIAKALDEAQCVVVVWSRHSISSSWVCEEADEGRKRGVLIPVLIDEIRPPLGFGLIQAASLIDWDGDPRAEAFEKLAADIAGVIRATAGPAPAVPPIVPTEPAHPVRQPQAAGPSSESRATSRRSFPRRTLSVWLMAAVAVAIVLAYNPYRTGRIADRRSPAAATGVRLSAVLAEGGPALARGVTFEVFEAEPNTEGHRKYITGSSHPYPSAWFPLPAGRYFVTARYLDASAGAEIEVTPAGATPRILDLRAGFLRVSAVLADTGDAVSGAAYDVYTEADVEGRRTRITGSSHQSQASAQFLLPAGRYLVTASQGGANARADTAVTAAQTQDLQLRLVPVTKR